MTDKYDKAIDHLTQNPEQIMDAWHSPRIHVAGCLFAFVGPACLTMMRNSPNRYKDYAFHDEIVADTRIPARAPYITVESLPVFAEWQRKINS